MKTIYIVRHAQAAGQRFDSPLTEIGVRQAAALARLFADKQIDLIYSSPFTRAISTIRPLADLKGLQIVEDCRLGERVLSSQYYPDWFDKVKQSFADFELVFEGGESQASGIKRAASILGEAIGSEAKNIVLVSHGNLSTLLLRYFDQNYGYEHWLGMTNPDVFEVCISGGNNVVTRIWET
ncbi:histidine phosphatase family protein [Bacillus sp. V33-4]|uniref:histidine phosphatase family protein n=1 Tax=Bacillus sp. V33-4 TaxID=2054169 RepID=UPI000C780E73|nr:histidine phosphatase family protein [Bacillus sp. V33-4]PLR84529.1 histidine phosphatase family protein [Bacillus sp. V33-4]